MPEISLTQRPPHVRHGSNIGQPLTRRDGVLKVTGTAPLRRRQSSGRDAAMRCMAVSSIARGRVTRPRRRRRPRRHPGVVEVMTPGQPAAAGAWIRTRRRNPFMFRIERAAERQGALRQPADRGGDRRDAGGGDRRRGAAGAALRGASRRASASTPARASCRRPSASAIRPRCEHGDVEAGLAAAAKRDRGDLRDAARNITTRWSRTPSSRPGTATRCRSTRRARAWRWRRRGIAGLFGIPPENDPHPQPVPRRRLRLQGLISGPQILGIMAARLVGRPVKLVLRREQMYGPVGHRAPTRQTLRIGADGDGAADRARPSRARRRRARFDDFFEPAADASHTLYASPAIATSHEAVRLDTGTPLFMRAPGEATGIDRAGKRDRRDGLGLRHGSAGVPAEELRRGRADLRQAVLLQGAARMLCAGRRALRLGGAPARAAADARRGRLAGRLGHGHRDLPGADVPGRGARGAARATAPAWWRPARTTWGRAPGPRSRRSRPTASGSTSTRSSSGPARPICRMPASPAARPTPRPPAWRSTTPAPTSIAKLADLATGDERSPLFGAGNAGVIARDGRLFRRDDESRERELCRHPRPRRAGRDRGPRQGRRRPGGAVGLRHACARRGLRRGEGRSRSRPGPRHPPGRRLRRRADHQPAPGAQPVSSAA